MTRLTPEPASLTHSQRLSDQGTQSCCLHPGCRSGAQDSRGDGKDWDSVGLARWGGDQDQLLGALLVSLGGLERKAWPSRIRRGLL